MSASLHVVALILERGAIIFGVGLA